MNIVIKDATRLCIFKWCERYYDDINALKVHVNFKVGLYEPISLCSHDRYSIECSKFHRRNYGQIRPTNRIEKWKYNNSAAFIRCECTPNGMEEERQQNAMAMRKSVRWLCFPWPYVSFISKYRLSSDCKVRESFFLCCILYIIRFTEANSRINI